LNIEEASPRTHTFLILVLDSLTEVSKVSETDIQKVILTWIFMIQVHFCLLNYSNCLLLKKWKWGEIFC